MLKNVPYVFFKTKRLRTMKEKVINPFLPNGTVRNPPFAKKENLESPALQAWQQPIGIQCRRAG